MRVMSLIITTFTIVALSTPSQAGSYNIKSLAIFLGNQACQGQPTAYKNGCKGYLDRRITQCRQAEQALSECNADCDKWYDLSKLLNNNACKQGCKFINDRD